MIESRFTKSKKQITTDLSPTETQSVLKPVDFVAIGRSPGSPSSASAYTFPEFIQWCLSKIVRLTVAGAASELIISSHRTSRFTLLVETPSKHLKRDERYCPTIKCPQTAFDTYPYFHHDIHKRTSPPCLAFHIQ